MCMTLGGRAAEQIVFGKISTGALSDLERITKMAYNMVTVYGMNDKIGNVSFYDSKQSDYNFNKPYSEATATTIDDEVRRLILDAYERTKQLLSEKRNELEIVAKELLAKEIIFQSDLEGLIGKRPFDRQTTYQAFTNRKVSGDGSVDLNTHALKQMEEEHKAKLEEEERKKKKEDEEANSEITNENNS